MLIASSSTLWQGKNKVFISATMAASQREKKKKVLFQTRLLLWTNLYLDKSLLFGLQVCQVGVTLNRYKQNVKSIHHPSNSWKFNYNLLNYEELLVQLPLVSIGGPRGSIIGGPLGSPIIRGSPIGGPLMSIGGPLISGGGPAAIWPMCTGGAWWGGGAPM